VAVLELSGREADLRADNLQAKTIQPHCWLSLCSVHAGFFAYHDVQELPSLHIIK
jgi:hypothetical protein